MIRTSEAHEVAAALANLIGDQSRMERLSVELDANGRKSAEVKDASDAYLPAIRALLDVLVARYLTDPPR